jgi:hypothetical protein
MLSDTSEKSGYDDFDDETAQKSLSFGKSVFLR